MTDPTAIRPSNGRLMANAWDHLWIDRTMRNFSSVGFLVAVGADVVFGDVVFVDVVDVDVVIHGW